MSKTIKEFISCDEQLRRWVDGESVHRLFTVKRLKCDDDGECCPDFSCCKPELMQPIEVRKAFAVANDEDRHGMLMMFLGAMLKCASQEKHTNDLNVYIAGRDLSKEV